MEKCIADYQDLCVFTNLS